MLDGYGIHPWQMERWTGREFDLLVRYERVKEQQQRDSGEV